ncbi:hypothetical protein BC938DRAFT_476601 [Jimgerdemannia flammicorona]|uniref:Uncharacterized protein n=1 Tax=Jimgerdemannia flammicorona TaxID=994334 RepID=A0A433PFR2_9FUNG|nr:hypothetical protein BC938DRAFT_476601 [Jimgerdemannia flammicorona]
MNSFLAAVSDVKDLVVAELSRVFPTTATLSPGTDDNLDSLHIPTADQVEANIKDFKLSSTTTPQQHLDVDLITPSSTNAVQRDALRSLTFLLSEPASPTLSNGHSDPDAIFSKLDVLETLCKLLFANRENQAEFRKMDGYAAIIKVFDEGPGGDMPPPDHEEEESSERREALQV